MWCDCRPDFLKSVWICQVKDLGRQSEHSLILSVCLSVWCFAGTVFGFKSFKLFYEISWMSHDASSHPMISEKTLIVAVWTHSQNNDFQIISKESANEHLSQMLNCTLNKHNCTYSHTSALRYMHWKPVLKASLYYISGLIINVFALHAQSELCVPITAVRFFFFFYLYLLLVLSVDSLLTNHWWLQCWEPLLRASVPAWKCVRRMKAIIFSCRRRWGSVCGNAWHYALISVKNIGWSWKRERGRISKRITSYKAQFLSGISDDLSFDTKMYFCKWPTYRCIVCFNVQNKSVCSPLMGVLMHLWTGTCFLLHWIH